MSGRSELARRHGHLVEIRGVMSAMRSLALVETHKLTRAIAHHAALRAEVEGVLGDFYAHYPAQRPDVGQSSRALAVVIGSERGFCGGFNERLLTTLRAALPSTAPAPRLVIVGQRLARRAPSWFGAGHVSLEGATVSEDVPRVMDRLVAALGAAVGTTDGAHTRILCISHATRGEPRVVTLLPPAAETARGATGCMPRLGLAPAEFHRQVLDHYLLSMLTGLLLDSFAAESRQRLAHMENAIERLDENLARLALRRNALRQARIVDEIEVILAAQQVAGG